jgi:hypothetical protein
VSVSLPIFWALFCNARTQKRLESSHNLNRQRDAKTIGGRRVGITEWLLVWLFVNALFVVWRVLVVSQAESRDLRSAENALDNLFLNKP